MNKPKRLLLPVAVAAAGFAGVSGASLLSSTAANAANTTSATTHYPSIVQKLADTFHLDPAKVDNVFQQDRQDHLKTRLDQAVKDGKLTSAQETALLNEMTTLHDQVESGKISRQDLKAQLDQWAKDNGIDLSQVMPGRHSGHMGHGMMGPMGPNPDTDSDSGPAQAN